MSVSYAVIYQSQTGNTKRIAEAIYEAVKSERKSLINVNELDMMPKADVYFVGFNIHNENCSIEIIDCLEEIQNGYVALFSSCGYVPTDEYKALIKRKTEVWLPEEIEYLGMFVCQGRIEEAQRVIMRDNMPDRVEILNKMFDIGDSHPDIQDYNGAVTFAKSIQSRVERKGNIPIL